MFTSSNGFKILIVARRDNTFKDVALEYGKKLELSYDNLNKLDFLFNAEKLKIDDSKTLGEIGFKSPDHAITVLDVYNIIGA